MTRPQGKYWLDKAIEQTAPGKQPEPDYKTWQQKHPQALASLHQRAQKSTQSRTDLSAVIELGRRIMRSPITKLAIAAVFIAGCLFVARHLKGVDTVPAPQPTIVQEIKREETQDNELALAQALYEQKDLPGLLSLLETGQEPTQLKIVEYLAEIGDASVVPALQRLADVWQGEGINPFQQAIVRIEARASEEILEQRALESVPAEDVRKFDASTLKKPTAGAKGIVVDRQGNRISGAGVALIYDDAKYLNDRILEQGITDTNGVFSLASAPIFERVNEHEFDRDKCQIVAYHSEFAFGWHTIHPGMEQPEYEIVLTEPTEHTITVVDVNEQPMSGVSVWVFIAGSREEADPLFRNYMRLEQNLGFAQAVTDVEGRACITNLPRTSCSYSATFEGYATGLAFSGQTRIRLTKGATVSGHVFTSLGKPVLNATVRLGANWMNDYFFARTNGRGEFMLRDLPADGWDMSAWGEGNVGDGSYTIRVTHDDYTAPGQEIVLQPDEVINDLDIEVSAQTTLLRCQVLTIDTLEPLAGARISGSNGIGRINGYSDANGIFTARVMPGPTSLFFNSPPDGVYVLRGENSPESSLRFEASDAEMSLVLKSPPIRGYLTEVFGLVEKINGMELSNAKVYPAAEKSFDGATVGNLIQSAAVDENGEFVLKGVPAGMGLHLYVETKDNLFAGAGTFAVPNNPLDDPFFVTMPLFPTEQAIVTISDSNGVPAANTRFCFRPIVEGVTEWQAERYCQTDENGISKIEGIVPGLTYYIRDAGFEELTPWPAEYESWIDTKIIFIPVETQPEQELQ